jgi:hypothetical protein
MASQLATSGRATWGLRQTFEELAARRGNAREEFTRRYQPFTEPADSRLGTGPPVAAGVATQQEWDTIAATLLRDPGSIVPALLREFPR